MHEHRRRSGASGRSSDSVSHDGLPAECPSASSALGLLERRLRPEPREDLARLLEHGRCLGRSAERHQAAPLAEQRLRLLVGHAEPVPAGGGVGEAGRRRLVLAARLGD